MAERAPCREPSRGVSRPWAPSSARASKSYCAPCDLHTRGSALRAPRRYAKRQGRCSNRNEPPICGTRHPRHFVANLRWQVCIVESAASSQSRGITMRILNGAQHPICGASNLTNAALEALGPPDSWPSACHRKRLRRPFLGMGGERVRAWASMRRCGPRGAAWASQRPRWPMALAAGGPGKPSAHLGSRGRLPRSFCEFTPHSGDCTINGITDRTGRCLHLSAEVLPPAKDRRWYFYKSGWLSFYRRNL